MDQGLVDIATEVVIWPIMVLFSVFFFVALGGMSLQARRTGNMDPAIWVLVGLLTTDLMALIMSLGIGIINPIVLGVLVGLTLFTGLWYFLSKGRFE